VTERRQTPAQTLYMGTVHAGYNHTRTTRQAIETEVLRALCATQLAPYKVPKIFKVLDEMPRTNVGKIDKQRLRSSVK
jgi:acyl-CoA synthetase (AMP-forming)/AMP-acid ligase II